MNWTDAEREEFRRIHREAGCSRCRFADMQAVIAGEPCCTRIGGPGLTSTRGCTGARPRLPEQLKRDKEMMPKC